MSSEREFYRVRELREIFGWSKPWVFERLHRGELVGIKVGGVLLIRASSVRAMLDKAEPWRPGGNHARG
jgi:hypothetical protein